MYLHVFCDAGEAAFGLAVYLRYNLGVDWTAKLMYISSKVAPAKNKLSIPKKELNAIVLGCIKGKYLEKIVKIPH